MEVVSYLLGKKSSGGGGGVDWASIGYSKEPNYIKEDINYAKNIYNNWDTSITDYYRKFYNDINLAYFPTVDVSNATSVAEMFNGCARLQYVEKLNFTEKLKQMGSLFKDCTNLREIGDLGNTSSIKNMAYLFSNCKSLKKLPIIDMSSCTSASNMFAYASNLSNESLDNILVSVISSQMASGNKKLYYLGFTSSMYSAELIQSLPHYQDFIDAGWTIGY